MGVPLLLVPGMLASGLETFGLGQKEIQVWPNDALLAGYGPGLLQLAPNGLDPGPLALYPLVASPLLPFASYDGLKNVLSSGGYSVYVYTYDWRKSLNVNAALLANFIETKMPQVPMKAVCHSMGGLLFRLAFGLLPTSFKSQFTTTIYLGTPHGGSLAAAQALIGNILPDNWVSQFATACRFVSSLVVPFLRFQGTNQALMNASLASWPALAEILPSSQNTWKTIDPLAPQLLQAGTYASYNSAVKQALLDNAAITQATLEGLLTADRPTNEVCVVGTGSQTPDTVSDITMIAGPKGVKNTAIGDGVVAVDRGVLPGSEATITLTGTSHSALVAGTQTLQFILSWLATPPATVTEPPVALPFPNAAFPPDAPFKSALLIPTYKQTRADP
jgi:hypothetical protein